MKHKVNRPEPLCPTLFPECPWQEVGIDFFQCQSLDYLIAVDYYSQFIEIATINRNKRGSEVVSCFKSISGEYANLPIIGDFLFRQAAPSSQDPMEKMNV